MKRLLFITFLISVFLTACWDESNYNIDNSIDLNDDSELQEIAQIVKTEGEEALTAEQKIKWQEYQESLEDEE